MKILSITISVAKIFSGNLFSVGTDLVLGMHQIFCAVVVGELEHRAGETGDERSLGSN